MLLGNRKRPSVWSGWSVVRRVRCALGHEGALAYCTVQYCTVQYSRSSRAYCSLSNPVRQTLRSTLTDTRSNSRNRQQEPNRYMSGYAD